MAFDDQIKGDLFCGMPNEEGDPIYVSKPSLPPLEDLLPHLENIWRSRTLTNMGPYHQRLEAELEQHLGVDNLSLVANGTLALIVGLNALDLSGEVITTPFTFAATAHAIKWSNLTPVFVDIDPRTFNLDPAEVEGAITEKTSCILPVHCYGNPCDTASLATVAKDNNLKLLYDGSHAFGVDCDCGSLLSHGDATTLSFHATKVFNTFEGGAIVCADRELKEKVDRLRNFGFKDETSFSAIGVNAKMNEFSAALGLLQIERVNRDIELRLDIADRYRKNLAGISGIQLPPRPLSSKPNGAYFPILITKESCMDRDCVYEYLKERKIIARRYFYPLVSDIYGHREKSHRQPQKKHAQKASESVICLPIYPDLSAAEVDYICENLISACRS